MSNQFHKLKVMEVRRETSDCVSVAFEVPPSLKSSFQFTPGQYLTLEAPINGQKVRRSYSICSAITEPELRVAIKQVPEGLFSTYANEHLQAGDQIEVMPPQGHFFKASKKKNAHLYVGFAAGSGITPVMSILKSTLDKEPDSKFVLFYGNRRTDTIIFKEELEGLKNKYLGRLELHHVLSQEDTGSDWFTGRIDKEKCEFYFDKMVDVPSVDAFYICGPYEMTLEIKDTLKAHGVEEEKIRMELFFVDAPKKKPVPKKKTYDHSSADAKINITLDGQTQSFAMDMDSESILDAAMKTGLDVPYSCKGGVCSTCKAKVEKGKVEMMINYALEQDEVDAGYVLSCQCYPLSHEITLNFDE